MRKRLYMWLLAIAFIFPLAALAQNYVQIWNREAEKPVTSSDPLQVTGTVSTITNPVKLMGVNGTTIMTAANPLSTGLSIGGAVISATNGVYTNLLQGNAVLTAANPIHAQVSTGGAAVSNTNPLKTQSVTVTQANITNTTAAIPAVSTAVALVASSTHLCIKTSSGAADLYVDIANGTATSADFTIEGGTSLTLDDLPGITAIKVLGASASGNYSVAAW